MPNVTFCSYRIQTNDQRLIDLRDRLAHCLTLQDEQKRTQFLRFLHPDVQMLSERFSSVGFDILAIVQTHLSYNALADFFILLHKFEKDQVAFVEAQSLAQKISRKTYDLWHDVHDHIRNDHLTRLKSILHGQSFDFERVDQAYRQSFKNGNIPTIKASSTDEQFLEMLWHTARYSKPPYHPLLTLVGQLSTLAQPAVQEQLQAWLSATAHELDVSLADHHPINPFDPEKMYYVYLVIKDVPDACDMMIKVKWSISESLETDEVTIDPSELPIVIKNILDTYGQMIPNLHVEVFVYLDVLHSYIPESWMWNKPKRKTPVFLRHLRALNLRLIDRIEDTDYLTPLRERWKTLHHTTPLIISEETMRWLEDSTRHREFRDAVHNDYVMLTGILCHPDEHLHDDEDELLISLLDAGIPCIVWLRQELPTTCTHDHKKGACFCQQPLDAVGTTLRKQRSDHHTSIWNYVSLMYDDPDRIPPVLKRVRGMTSNRST